MEGRILSLDFGSKTVGVAVTDALGITAQAVETIVRERPTKLRQTLARIAVLCEQYDVKKIILGRPYNMDGTEGFRIAETEDFCELLKKRVDIPIEYVDERLTTMEADDILAETGVKKEDRKKVIDMVAAQLILEDYIKNVRKN